MDHTRYNSSRHLEWVSALQQWDFGDSGAFDDIPILQFPLNRLGERIANRPPVALESVRMIPPPRLPASQLPQSSALQQHQPTAGSSLVVAAEPVQRPAATTAAPPGSRLRVAQTAESQLVVKSFGAEELAKPSMADVERERLETEAALSALTERRRAEAVGGGKPPITQSVVRVVDLQAGASSNGRVAAIAETRRDPFDPKTTKLVKKQQTGAVDTAPIIRSPTKKPSHGEFPSNDDFKLPGVVMQWSNSKGKIRSLDAIESVDGAKHRSTLLSSGHAANRAALQQAEQQLQEDARLRAAAAMQMEEDRNKAEHDRLQRLAQDAVREKTQHVETREERLARRQEEKELRERLQEEKKKQHRIEKVAKQLGLSADEVSENELLRRQILEVAPVTESGELDPRLVHARGNQAHQAAADEDADEQGGSSTSLYSTTMFSGGGGMSDALDVKAVQAEMERQKAQQARGGGAASAGVTLGDMDDQDEDDDAFGIAGMLRK